MNPTVDELSTFNLTNHLHQEAHLENYPFTEEKRAEHARINFAATLGKKGYSFYSGKEVIDRFIHLDDWYDTKDKTSLEGGAPLDLSLIENEADYLVDREVYRMPLKVTEPLLKEVKNHAFRVLPANLSLYFEHVRVTKRGMESRDVLPDKQISFYFYEEITDYLQENEFESLDTAYHKLAQNKVNLSLPFAEIIADNYTECYINTEQLKTEEAILSFVNQAYTIEGLDLEAKSFNRKRILMELLKRSIKGELVPEDEFGNKTDNRWDDKNYTFK